MPKPSSRLLRQVALFTLVGLTAALASCVDEEGAPRLHSLNATGASGSLYPSFDPAVLHYGMPCSSTDTLSISASANGSRSRVKIHNEQQVLGSATATITGVTPDQDIVVTVSRNRTATHYTIHCVPTNLPIIHAVRHAGGVSEGLLYLTPQFVENSIRKTYLLIADNNGVARFAREVIGTAVDFKPHANGLFTYALSVGPNEFGLVDNEVVVLDQSFAEVRRLTTVGLNHTDNHDVILLDGGGAVLLSYHSSVRDMTAFGLGSSEVVGDSIIQELDAEGDVLLQWNSWDHLDLHDCQATGYTAFPRDYAHINSVSITPDGNLIASFRGCSQVVKIDRETGAVIWRLGGTNADFAIVSDRFGEFCGQHTASQVGADRVLIFDNGSFCLGGREETFGRFSRAVEYRLDSASGEALFVRDYSLDDAYQAFSRSQGSVQLLDNGNWLIGWGSGPQIAVTEVSATGQKLFELSLTANGNVSVSYRAHRDNQP